MKVVLACRSQKKCDDAVEGIRKETGKKNTVNGMLLDLGDFSSIRSFASSFEEKYSQINGLILNAGIMMPPFQLTVDGIESTIGVNHFGHFLLVDLLMPKVLIAASKDGVATIVSVSSSASFDSYPEGIMESLEEMNKESRYMKKKAYGQSKLANILFAQELAERYKSQNVLVNSVHPGAVETDLGRHVLESFENEYAKAAVEAIYNNVFKKIVWSPKDAALTQLFTAISPKLIDAKITGKYYHPIAREVLPDPHARNKTLQKQLWKLSEEITSKN